MFLLASKIEFPLLGEIAHLSLTYLSSTLESKSKLFADLIRWYLAMLTIAKRCIRSMLALAEVSLLVLFCYEGFGREASPLVRTIAKRLIGGLTTGAKVILFSCLEINRDRLVTGDCWIIHIYLFYT